MNEHLHECVVSDSLVRMVDTINTRAQAGMQSKYLIIKWYLIRQFLDTNFLKLQEL